VMIPTFNCARFLGEALAGVLEQDLGPERMQIEVVDDASAEDDPEAIVRDLSRGRVAFFRQQKNVGHLANFATCLERSRGRIVHLLHGDDLVRPGFYAKLGAAFDADADLGAAFCRNGFIDGAGRSLSLAPLQQPQSGRLPNALERLAEEQRIVTPAIAVRREVYERLGGFDRRLECSEDWEMWVRIAAHYPIWYEPEPLALYRMHEHSNTGRHFRFADEMAYTRRAIELFQSYLPPDRAAKVARRARATYALASLRNAAEMLAKGDHRAMGAHLTEALRLSRSRAVLRGAGRLLLQYGRKVVASG
jgi:glycosyltransferase involved in cell wall biosynthesis